MNWEWIFAIHITKRLTSLVPKELLEIDKTKNRHTVGNLAKDMNTQFIEKEI